MGSQGSNVWTTQDLLVSPTNTDWVDPIYTLVTLYHKTNRSYGFTNALFVSLAFATHSLAPLCLQRLRLLRCFRGNTSPALSPHERRINLITGLQYNTPIAVRHFSLVAPVSVLSLRVLR